MSRYDLFFGYASSEDEDNPGAFLRAEVANSYTDDEEEAESDSDTYDDVNTFDTTLSASHSYLGQELVELHGRTVLDGIHMNLPLFMQPLVLLPGQTLSIIVHNRRTIEMLKNCIQSDHTFGVMNIGYWDNMEPVGTTAEIYEYTCGYTEGSSAGFCVKAKGRQRFKVLRVIEVGHNKKYAHIKVLPEVTLPHPLAGQRVISLDNTRIHATNEEELSKQKRVETMDAAASPWPAWVYRQYDPVRLSIQLRNCLKLMNRTGYNIPTDPTDLSYWIAQNLIVEDHVKTMLLNYNCAIQRLQAERKCVVLDQVFVCRTCDVNIAKAPDICSMSKDGPQSAYCNPDGHIHETITFCRAKHLKLTDFEPSTECSWFPGYGWSIAKCISCDAHMGWKFTAVNEGLRPKSFWALTRRSLRGGVWKQI